MGVAAGAVLDWASVGLVVADQQYVAAIEPTKEFYGRNEAIEGTVKWKTIPGQGLTAAVELWDTYERLTAVAAVDVGTGRFQFPPQKHLRSRTYRLVAKVMEKDFAVDRKTCWIGMPSNELDDYQCLYWAAGLKSRSGQVLMHQCREFGLTGYYDGTVWFPPELICRIGRSLGAEQSLGLSILLWTVGIQYRARPHLGEYHRGVQGSHLSPAYQGVPALRGHGLQHV